MKDIWLPATVIMVVAMMVLPLPGFLLDYFIMINIAGGIILLIGVVYLKEPETFTSLPSLLLLATLLRLGLNVSTTRQILSTGVAPDVIKAFGEFMVQGNFIVGLTVFLIITLIQFIVIAKGSERVAEVAARFTLDALPGKQMSIDADLRSGIISIEQARKRRADLQREARLYAALDGAMKFIKGDAIAGLIISAINIIAGLLVGSVQLGLSIGEAAQAFVVYAVGDGLSSQIPALLVSVAAGIAVTRVADKDSDLLSRDIFSQLTNEPKALMAAGVVMVMFALFPGMPVLPFLFAAAAFFFVAKTVKQAQQADNSEQVVASFNAKPTSEISVRLSPVALRSLQQSSSFISDVQKLREDIFEETGVLVPEPNFDVVSIKDAATCFEVWVRGARASACAEKVADNFGAQLIESVKASICAKISEFVDDTHTRILLEFHSPNCEDIINYLVPEKLPVTTLTQILRQLVVEKVSIKDLKLILQALSEFVETGSTHVFSRPHMIGGDSPRHALQVVRQALGKQIVQSLVGDKLELQTAVVDPQLDAVLVNLEEQGVPVSPALSRHLQNELSSLTDVDAVVSSSASRLFVWRLTGSSLPALAIEEIPADIKIVQNRVIKDEETAVA